QHVAQLAAAHPNRPVGEGRRRQLLHLHLHQLLRTLPYVRARAERYRDDGLVMIGAPTPEFSFEHDVQNVEEMLAAMRVDWPIAIDNEYAVWGAFANHYWLALYFVDAGGRIRH